jgi:hypothetical protein
MGEARRGRAASINHSLVSATIYCGQPAPAGDADSDSDHDDIVTKQPQELAEGDGDDER